MHRLLGSVKDSVHFRHNQDNPLPYDIVVIDEASMVDLAMMSRLVDALKPGCRLVLLGDRNQLSSVEAGTVLADAMRGLDTNVAELRKSFRFDTNIREFAAAIIENRQDDAWQLLTDAHVSNLHLALAEIAPFIFSKYEEYIQLANQAKRGTIELFQLFQQFQQFQVLCCLKRGRYGVEGINRLVESELARQGFPVIPDDWYQGRPVMVMKNDYSLGLFNGDIGICLFDEEDGDYRVWFQGGPKGYRSFPSRRMGMVETVYGMTVHKSQGSEFNQILVVLPGEDNRILSRELLYTAVTRAREEVFLAGDKPVFGLALQRKVERYGGLHLMLEEDSLS